MRTRVQRWLPAPIFPDEEQTRIAGLLNLLLLSLIVLLLLDAALLLVFAPETLPTFWVNGVGILVSCVLLRIMRRGGVRLAGIILCLSLWPLMVYYLAISGGLESPSLGFLGLFIVIGVTLFGTRGAIGLGLVDLVCLGVFYVGGRNGLLVSIEGPPTLSRLFATNSIFFLLLTALVAISGHSVYDALIRARKGEIALAERNRELNREIAERKRATDTLQRNEANMRAILDNSALSYVLMDTDQRVITVNRAAQLGSQAVFGRDIQPGDLFTEFLSESEYEDFQQNFDRALRGESALSERTFVISQGQTRYFAFRYFPAIATDGQVLGVCLSTQDTTEREQSQNALRESEQKFRALSEQSLMGISIMQDNKLKYVNQAVANINGYTVEEMLGWDQIDFGRNIYPDDLLFAADQARKKQNGDPDLVTHYQYRIVTKTGQVRWVEQFSKTIEFESRPANLGVLIDITERKQAEDALRASEERYRIISEMISDYAFAIHVEPDGTMETEWITESFTRMTGYTASEMLEREMQQRYALFHPEDRMQMETDMAELLQGNPTDNEYRMITKSSEVHWMHFYRHPVWDESHQRVVRYYGIVQDITKRILAEQELQRRDAILEAVSTATSYFLRAADWQQEIVNVLGILGRAALVDRVALFQTHPDTVGKPLASLRYEWDAPDILPMQDQPSARNIDLFQVGLGSVVDKAALRQPLYFHVKDRPATNRTLGESTGTKTFSLHPILLHEDLWGGLVLATTQQERDWSKIELEALQIAADMLGTVMERKQAESALQQSAARLNILHRIDRAILAAASAEAIAQAALQSIRQLTPWQSATIEFIDSDTSERVILAVDMNGEHSQHPGSRHPLDLRWLETFKAGQTYVVADVRSSPDSLPVFRTLMNDSVRSLAVIPLVAHDKVLGSLDLMASEPNAFTQDYLEIGREVADQLAVAIEHAQLYELAQRHATELEQRVQERTVQLETANTELRVLSRIKDEFVSNVSHELRTPITSLTLRYYLLSKQPNQLDVHLPVIRRETDRLARIIEELLALSRMDQDRTQFNLTAVDLNNLIQQFVTDRLLLAEDRGLTLDTAVTTGNLPVHADAGLLEQVLSILLTNALNYTPRGGQVIVGTWVMQMENRSWTGFSVSDTGPGISKKDQEKLFSRFFRGQAGRESGVSGTGLGLALAREIVDRHNGRIEVKSDGVPGQGTTFNVWLPGPTVN